MFANGIPLWVVADLELLTLNFAQMKLERTNFDLPKDPPLLIAEVIGSTSDDDNWTCGCLYKCNDCIRLESNGESKHDYFERKDLDYWDE